MAGFRPHLSRLRAQGAELVVIGSGWPAAAKAFRERLQMSDVPVVCDPALAAYKIAGFRRSRWSTLHPGVWWAGIRAFFRGFLQRSRKGDPWQQGGVLVIAPGGKVLYRFASRFAGDHPPPARVVDAIPASV